MSFTTNGNMHRHMRIHEKEATGGSNVPTSTSAVIPKETPISKHAVNRNRPQHHRKHSDSELRVENYSMSVPKVSRKGSSSAVEYCGKDTNVQALPTPALKRQLDVEKCEEGPTSAKRVLSMGDCRRDASYISPERTTSDCQGALVPPTVAPYAKLLDKATSKVS